MSDHQLPLVVELDSPPDVETALRQLAAQPHSVLLDSAMRDERLGRYSFLAADPFEFVAIQDSSFDGLGLLADMLQAWPAVSAPGLPPFQGGAVVLLSYE